MKRTFFGYFLLSKKERAKIRDIYLTEQEKCDESLSVWMTFAVIGNLLPVAVVFLTNLAVYGSCSWLNFINNGTISLVGYNIIISAIFYLLDATKPSYENLKKKILGIGILMLFLNITLFTFQSTSLDNIINDQVLVYTFLISLILLFFTTASGRYMVVLQKDVIGRPKDISEEIAEKRKELNKTDNTEDVEY